MIRCTALTSQLGCVLCMRLLRPAYEDLQSGVSERPVIVQAYGLAEKNVSSIYHQPLPGKQDLKGTTH